jgi:hypothetical protein
MNYEYITAESLPEGTVLTDPSHLKADSLMNIWDHWRAMQGGGTRALTFLKGKSGDTLQKAVPKKKKNVPYTEEEEEEEEEEENSRGNVQMSGKKSKTASTKASGSGPGKRTGESSIHPLSPLAHAGSKSTRKAFLQKLSSEPPYQKWLANLESTHVCGNFVYVLAWCLTHF